LLLKKYPNYVYAEKLGLCSFHFSAINPAGMGLSNGALNLQALELDTAGDAEPSLLAYERAVATLLKHLQAPNGRDDATVCSGILNHAIHLELNLVKFMGT